VRKFETEIERDEDCIDETKTAITVVGRVTGAVVDRERDG